jgi:hypothetical protein
MQISALSQKAYPQGVPSIVDVPELIRHFSGTVYVLIGMTRCPNCREYNNWRIFPIH